MSDSLPPQNPYQAPSTDVEATAFDDSEGLRSIRELAKWQRFLSVMMWIGTVLMLVFLAIQLIAFQQMGAVEAIGSLSCMFVLMVLFYVIPAVLLWRGSTAAKQLVQNNGKSGFVEFARSQMIFWRIIGIFAAIVVIAYGGMLLLAVVGGAFL